MGPHIMARKQLIAAPWCKAKKDGFGVPKYAEQVPCRKVCEPPGNEEDGPVL